MTSFVPRSHITANASVVHGSMKNPISGSSQLSIDAAEDVAEQPQRDQREPWRDEGQHDGEARHAGPYASARLLVLTRAG